VKLQTIQYILAIESTDGYVVSRINEVDLSIDRFKLFKFFKSEEMGFEPMIQKLLYVDLANQCLKPLSHTSTN
jgi:hypothetical protein